MYTQFKVFSNVNPFNQILFDVKLFIGSILCIESFKVFAQNFDFKIYPFFTFQKYILAFAY